MLLKETDFFLKFAALSFQLFLFLFMRDHFAFVVFVLILFLINFPLQSIQLLEITLVLLALEKRFSHDLIEFDLKSVSVSSRLVNFFLDQNVCL